MIERLQPKTTLRTGLILLAFTAYISLGLPDGLLGVAWPSIRHTFSLNHDSFGAVMVAFTAGYLASSFCGGRLMAHFKLGILLSASTLCAAAALLSYSAASHWWIIVAASSAAGLGGGGIDATLNNYVAVNHGDRLMQWLHASYGIGATAGPVVMTAGLAMTGSWRPGYLVVGLLQLALSLSFMFTVSMWGTRHENASASQNEKHPGLSDASLAATLRYSRVWLSIALFFMYMGVEVAFGSWAYSLLTESRGVAPQLAGYWVGSFWGIFTIGRFIAGILTSRVTRMKLVTGGLVAALSATIILALDIHDSASLAAIIVIGLAIAPVLPALISGTANRVGSRHTANTIGIQIAAMGAGGATIPSLCGIMANHFSLEAIPLFMIFLITILIFSNAYAMRPSQLSTRA